MSNLIVEYQKRHKSSSVPMCHNGLCFFEHKSDSPIIAMISLPCRSFVACHECDGSHLAIVELFQRGYNGSFVLINHKHVDPCRDLAEYVKENGYTKHKPYYAKKPRDLELWLWKFCDLKPRGFKATETDPELKIIEQMAYCAIKQPKLYHIYYVAYEAFLLSRKYLLFGEK